MNRIIKKELKKLNLSEKEVNIYLTLLKLGESNIQRISKNSKISRTTTYAVIDSLREKGLVLTTRRQKRIFYYAEDPEKIGDSLEEKLETFNKILPELLSMSNLIDKKPKVTFYEGEEGIKNIYRHTLNYPDSEMLAWTSVDEGMRYIDNDFLFKEYVPKRVKNKIWAKVIASETEASKEYTTKDSQSLREVRFMKKTLGRILEVEIMLYGKNIIAFQSFKEGFGLIVESEKIYNTLKIIFYSQWDNLNK